MFKDEAKLIKECLAGSRSAWNLFVDQFTRLIYDAIIRTLRRYGQDTDPHVLEELHNDVFVVLLEDECKALRNFRGNIPVACYLRTITVNKTIDHLRNRKSFFSLDDGSEWTTLCAKGEEFFSHEDYNSILSILVQHFTEKEEKLFFMIFRDEISIVEISQRLNVSVDYYYVLKQRLLKKIKKISLDNKIVEK